MRRRSFPSPWVVALALVLIACSGGGGGPAPRQEVALSIGVTSQAFTEGASIPIKHTCAGENRSPHLKWTGVPQGAESIALISDDPDAPGGAWVHWVLYALPPDAAELSGGVPPEEVLPNGGRQGITDFKQIGYGGPCPSPSSPYRYLFKVYAMDTQVGLAPGATKKELLAAMDGHILAQGQLTGTYQRR